MYRGSERLTIGYRDLPKDTVDVLLLGNSTMMNDVYPLELWNDYGITAYNAACVNQSIASSYYIIQDFLEYHSPKVIVLDCQAAKNGGKYISENTLHYVTDAYGANSKISRRIIQDLVEPSKRIGFYFPLFAYHNQWQSLSNNNFHPNDRDISFGGKVNGRTKELDDITSVAQERTKDIPEIPKEYLEKIIALANEHNIKLVFTIAPTARSLKDNEKANNYYMVYNEVGKFAEANGVDYINFNYMKEELGIDEQTDYADSLHMNFNGAEKLTSYFGKMLAGMVENHKEDGTWEYTDLYNSKYADFQYYKNDTCIRSATDIHLYLKALARCKEDYLIVIAVKDIVGYKLDETINNELKALGVNTDLVDKGQRSYIFVSDNGDILYDKLNEEDNVADTYNAVIDKSLRLYVVSAPLNGGNTANIKINDYDYSFDLRGLNIVVYDKKSGNKVDAVNFDTHSMFLKCYRTKNKEEEED
ncbi:MAG: hypothetical protein J6D29_09195 [Solobacterium sp.]|nr:hypothetical protein [Solobacterium sp.]